MWNGVVYVMIYLPYSSSHEYIYTPEVKDELVMILTSDSETVD